MVNIILTGLLTQYQRLQCAHHKKIHEARLTHFYSLWFRAFSTQRAANVFFCQSKKDLMVPRRPVEKKQTKKTDGPSLVLIVVPVEKCFLVNTCWSHTCTLVGGHWSHSVLVFCWKRQHQKTESSPPIKTSPPKNNPHQKMPKYKDCKCHNDSLP